VSVTLTSAARAAEIGVINMPNNNVVLTSFSNIVKPRSNMHAEVDPLEDVADYVPLIGNLDSKC
jgi:hypothetical protein